MNKIYDFEAIPERKIIVKKGFKIKIFKKKTEAMKYVYEYYIRNGIVVVLCGNILLLFLVNCWSIAVVISIKKLIVV